MSNKQQPTLYEPAVYDVIVPGALDGYAIDWEGVESVSIKSDGANHVNTTLKCTVDQAALISLIRLLYSIGVPLISVTYRSTE